MNVPSSNPTPALFYVFSQDHNHGAPVAAEMIARGVLTGRLAESTLVARVGAPSWTPLASVPEIGAALQVARGTPSSMRPTNFPPATPISIPPPPALPAEMKPAGPTGEKKDEKKEPPLDPRFKFLPLAIFGVFAFFALVETITVVAMR